MKDQWQLYEDALNSDFKAFIDLNEKAYAIILKFFLILSKNDFEFSRETTIKIIASSFHQLKNKSLKISFLFFILNQYKYNANDIKLCVINNAEKYQDFLNVYVKNHYKDLSTLDANISFEDYNIQIDLFLPYLQSNFDEERICVEIKHIKEHFNCKLKAKYKIRRPFFIVLLSAILVLVFYGLKFIQIKNEKTTAPIHKKIYIAPYREIFKDYLNSLSKIEREVDDDSPDELIENQHKTLKMQNENNNSTTIEQLPIKELGDLSMPSPIKNEEKDEISNKKPNEQKEKEDVLSISDKDSVKNISENQVDVGDINMSTPKELVENHSSPKEYEKNQEIIEKNDNAAMNNEKKNESNEDNIEEKQTTNESEMVVINDDELPMISENNKLKQQDSIILGDNKTKRDLKDFRDQKVTFYSFLEVKDVEKAKNAAFAILKKFGYIGQVLKTEKDYIVLTATFPGKENHDKMIKKFNGLGTLYVGNDVAEFLELYKKDLDRERNEFFPKYKPEDLPKEVTVNLYVFPKQTK